MATIYADNAATTQMSRAAIDAMLPYLETIYGNPSSLHSVGQQAAGVLLSARPHRQVPERLPARNLLHLRRQRGRQSGHPLRRAPRRTQRQKAHHFDRIRAPRRAAHAEKA